MTRTDIYQTVTNDIIAAIEAGQTSEKFTLPWAGAHGLPTNAATSNVYRGINIPVLWAHQQRHGYSSHQWATYKQWQALGAQVKKGEKASSIVFWKNIETQESEAEETQPRMVARWSAVFNADQVEGYQPATIKQGSNVVDTIMHVEHFINNTKAIIIHGGTQAFYDLQKDMITLPERNLFRGTEERTAVEAYYATALHELTHWTGAGHRLDRFTDMTKHHYAYEELIAELGSAMLCTLLNITGNSRHDHAQYIDGWLRALKNNKMYIFSAASKAQKAVDFLYGLQPK
jgi:antirestriction protein ArdC